MKKLFQLNVYIISLLLIFSAFLYAQKVETVDGVRVVHNEKSGKWGKNPKVSLELVRRIGELETEDENIAFHIPSDIAIDDQGNIYVLDAGNHRIQKFDPDGKYLATFGRRGQGPGEFYMPSSLDLDNQGYMYVSDPQNQRVQILKPDGTEHKTISFHHTPAGIVRVNKSGELVMGKGGIMISMGGGESSSQGLPKIIKVLDLEGNVQREFGEAKKFKDEFIERNANSFHFALDKDDKVYVAFDFQNRIEKYSPEGQLLWSSDRDLSYSTDLSKAKADVKRSGGNMNVQMPQMNRCSNGIAVDGKGRVWVVNLKRQMKEEERVGTRLGVTMAGGQRSVSMSFEGATDLRETDMYQLEIYDQEGILLGIVPLTQFVDDIWIIKDRIFMLDKMRGAQFYEYRIIEK
jgi:sugar lactone lactonase YvrE